MEGELHGAAIFEVMAIGKAAHALEPTTELNCVAKFKIKAAKLRSKKIRIILSKNQQICWQLECLVAMSQNLLAKYDHLDDVWSPDV